MMKVINKWKRSNTLGEVKPVKNKNPQSFLEISKVQK